MTPVAWRGIAAIILAAGLAAAVVILAVETMLHPGAIGTEEASLLSTVLGAVVGAIAVYLGGHTSQLRSEPPVPSSPSKGSPRSEGIQEAGPEPPAPLP